MPSGFGIMFAGDSKDFHRIYVEPSSRRRLNIDHSQVQQTRVERSTISLQARHIHGALVTIVRAGSSITILGNAKQGLMQPSQKTLPRLVHCAPVPQPNSRASTRSPVRSPRCLSFAAMDVVRSRILRGCCDEELCSALLSSCKRHHLSQLVPLSHRARWLQMASMKLCNRSTHQC